MNTCARSAPTNASDVCERLLDRAVELFVGEMREARGDAGDELLELDAMPQRFLRLAPLGRVDGHGHEVGDGGGEVLFLHAPRARRADVLEADHAGGLAEAADRDVEHGGDAERDEVGLGECAGARIEPRVVRGDDPLGLEGLEVDRILRGLQLAAVGVDAGRALEQLLAADATGGRA